MNEKWRKVGKIKESHGLRGDLFVLVFSKDISWISSLKKFGLSSSDEALNLQILEVEKAKPFKTGLIVKVAGIADRTQADTLKGQMFFIPEELLESKEGETIYLSEIAGFEICNSQSEKLGKIVAFSSNGAQDLLVVEKLSGGQAEIPFVEDFIINIDFEAQSIQMNLPEGIWDLASL